MRVPAARHAHSDRRCTLSSRPPRFCRAASKEELQKYFADHQIQEKINVWLNDMVIARPDQPFAWLADQMRKHAGSAPLPAAAASTTPVFPSGAAGEALANVVSSWGYIQSMRADAAAPSASPTPAPAAAPTPKAPPKPKGLALTIEKLGDSSLMLCIRPAA